MDRIILIACATLVTVHIYSEMILANPSYEASVYSNKYKDDNKVTPLWFGSNLGRRKRNLKNGATQQELIDSWEALIQSPASVTVDGNDKFICKRVDKTEFNPRLGRNTEAEELSGGEKWLRDIVAAEVDESSPPFAPRLGRKLSPYSPRLGREA